MKVWFDIDGVLSNIYKQDLKYGYVKSDGTVDFEKLRTRKYAPGKEFWGEMEILPAGLKVFNFCVDQGYEIGILTSKGPFENVAVGKTEWLSKNQYITSKLKSIIICDFGSGKKLLAGLGGILIDDWKCNTDEWVEAGGEGAINFKGNADEVIAKLLEYESRKAKD